MRSEATENYLTAILRLEDDLGVAATKVLADRLSVAPPSVTGMLKKLDRDGLVNHERYRGTWLTPEGRVVAEAVLRRHRLVETFLVRELGLPEDQVHAEACRLEHALSDKVVDRLDAWLGLPLVDPHGTSIPRPPHAATQDLALSRIPAGSTVAIDSVRARDDDHAAYLTALGLIPGAEVEVIERRPFGGPLTLEINDHQQVVGPEVTEYVTIRKED